MFLDIADIILKNVLSFIVLNAIFLFVFIVKWLEIMPMVRLLDINWLVSQKLTNLCFMNHHRYFTQSPN
jgi:hypothetical protein